MLQLAGAIGGGVLARHSNKVGDPYFPINSGMVMGGARLMNPYVSTLLILYAPYPLWPSELARACVSKVIVRKRITHFSEHGLVLPRTGEVRAWVFLTFPLPPQRLVREARRSPLAVSISSRSRSVSLITSSVAFVALSPEHAWPT